VGAAAPPANPRTGDRQLATAYWQRVGFVLSHFRIDLLIPRGFLALFLKF
jgi:hypothetical protein